MADQFADTDMTPSVWHQRKPNLNLRYPNGVSPPSSSNAFPNDGGDFPQGHLPGLNIVPLPHPATSQYQSSNPPPNDMGPKLLPRWAIRPDTPDLSQPTSDYDEPKSPLRKNYAKVRAQTLGIDDYKPEIPRGSSFPPSVFKDIYRDHERMKDTPLQQQIKFDVEIGVTQNVNVPTMSEYAQKLRDQERMKKEREANTSWMKRQRKIALVGERRDPLAPNGCIYELCNMPRGVHSGGCMGVGREGVTCSEDEHAVGNCDERADNRRQKMDEVGLNPDTDDPYVGMGSSWAPDPNVSFEEFLVDMED